MMNSISQSRINIWVIPNNPNLIQRCSLYFIEHTELVSRNCGYKLHSGSIFTGQMDGSLGAQNYSIILLQPIHAKNYIYAPGIYDDEVPQKVYPLMAILIAGHICLAFISPPGELTSMVYFMTAIGRLCSATNFDDMKECDAPESNKIIAGYEFAGNIPSITSWGCWASSTVT
jgi:hypothetical protein